MSPARLHRASFGGTRTDVDVLVVGGGITGAAIAYEAASRGLSVALAERGDYGAATSAATGKLIHGGLRYLGQREFRLVRESLAERRTLMQIAPNLVEPIGMVLPDPGLVERLGLTAYDLLSLDRNRIADRSKRIPRHRRLSRRDLDARGLEFLERGVLFHDAIMPAPERLTLAFVQSATAHGALVANAMQIEELLGSGDRIIGARVVDRESGMIGELRAGVTVNATGPWARDLLAASSATAVLAGPRPAVRSEGIYLVTRQLTETMVLTVSGRSHFSFAPWRGLSLIGPTETAYRGEVRDWRLTRASIEGFIAAINEASSMAVRLSIDDVVAAYGGLRPLTEQAGDDTYGASRAAELVDHRAQGVAGIVSATGGKYTTSRAFAEHAVDKVAEQLGKTVAPSQTAHRPLTGCDIGALAPAVERGAAARGSLGADVVEIVSRLYGTAATEVLRLAESDPKLAQRATADGVPFAAVAYSARHESPVHLTDLLLRRTGIANVGDPGEETLRVSAQIAGAELGWSAERQATEIDAARHAVRLPED